MIRRTAAIAIAAVGAAVFAVPLHAADFRTTADGVPIPQADVDELVKGGELPVR